MRANTDRAPGVTLVTDHPSFRDAPPAPPVALPDEHEHDRELVVVRARLSAGIAVQLLLDTSTGEMFVTTVVAGKCVTVPVEREDANEWYEHPGAFGLLPQLAK